MINVKLHPKQYLIATDPHRFRVAVCGRRFGKSTLAQLIILQWATEQVGTYWIVSPSYKTSKMIHWRELQKLTPREWVLKKNEVELSITLKNGSIIELKGAENPDALRGVKLRGLVVDECASIRNWDWLWSEVLRPTLTDYEAPALFIGTPKGYNAFYELYQLGIDKNDLWKSFHFTSYDNPYIPKGEIDNAKNELTEDTFYQEYMADFRKYTGLVYKEFDRAIHVIEPFDIPNEWTIYRGMDFGSTNPTAVLWIAVDGDENTYIVGEHYQTGQTIDYHSGIINAHPLSGRVQSTFGDPSGAQWISEFAERGVYITPANKETGQDSQGWVRFGIEKVAEKLKQVPGHTVQLPRVRPEVDSIHIQGGSSNSMPALFIFSTCTNVIREIESYRWKEKSVTQAQDLNEPEAPEKANDHCFTGDTLILTMAGWKRIDAITKGEFVWSPFGWNEVYRSGSTGKKVVKDYGVFSSTPDHKVLTDSGLKEVDILRYSDRILIWTNRNKWSLMEYLIGATQMPRGEVMRFILGAVLTKAKMARRDFYIETYGNTIMARSLSLIWSTILTVTLVITTSLTLSLSLLVSMLSAIIGAYGRGRLLTLIKLGISQKLGMGAKRDERSTQELLKKLGPRRSGQIKHVLSAIRSTRLPSLVEASIVIKTAKQQILGEEEVYNLATKFGMYFANGVLVSNSMDALRYFAVSYRKQLKSLDLPPTHASQQNWSLSDNWKPPSKSFRIGQ